MIWLAAGAVQAGVTVAPVGIDAANTIAVDAALGNDSTGRRGTITSPYRTLTNALMACQNGDTILLRPGTYTNNTIHSGVASSINGNSPLKLWNRTNVTIMGTGPGCIVKSTVTNESDLFRISNCANIRITGITFQGTRIASGARSLNADMIALAGTNTYFEIDRCEFRDWMGEGIVQGTTGEANNSSKFRIHDNYFYNIGCTNALDLAGAQNGAAVYLFSDSIIANNLIESCDRGIEQENQNAPMVGGVIEGNVIKDVWFHGIIFVTSGSHYDQFGQTVIAGNIIEGESTNTFVSGMTGIDITGSSGLQIVNNKIRNITTGISIADTATNNEAIHIIGNHTLGCYQPFTVTYGVSSRNRDMIISQNTFQESAGQVDVAASNVQFTRNQFINVGASATYALILRDAPNNGGASNILVEGNSIYNNSGTTANGMLVLDGIRNVRVINNWIGPNITTPMDYRADGVIEQEVYALSIGANVSTLLSFTAATNANIFASIEATGIATNRQNAANLARYGGWRNTNGLMSNILNTVTHTYTITNSTDIGGWYVDITNTTGGTLNYVLAGSAGTNIQWRALCKARIMRY